MKKLILAIVMASFSFVAFSQTTSGDWNKKTATYSNLIHGIKWELLEYLVWVGRPILDNSTLVSLKKFNN